MSVQTIQTSRHACDEHSWDRHGRVDQRGLLSRFDGDLGELPHFTAKSQSVTPNKRQHTSMALSWCASRTVTSFAPSGTTHEERPAHSPQQC